MASFTDSLMQFNPYVQQVPVDTYARVGMEEQQKYNQGVARVQGDIDSIGGMDIAHPEQQEYVRQRLEQLKGKVQGVLSADFSKDQLVNQIGSMAGQISNDPIIQNAVVSTARYRSELGKMQKAKQDGKSNIVNETDFSNQVGSWLNNKDVKSSFTGEYTPYTDVRKKAMDIIKDLHPDGEISENAFTYGPDGKLTLSDDMAKQAFKGVSPQKIQQALYNGFNQDDFHQMEMEGKYAYSNKTPRDMQGIVEDKINGDLQAIDKKRQVLINTKSGLSDVQAKNQIDAQLAALDDQQKSVLKEGDGYKKQLLANPDGVKAQLYTNQFLGSISNALSYSEITNERVNNPAAEMQMKRDQLNQQYQEFKVNNEHWLLDYQLRAENLQIKKDKANKDKVTDGLTGVPQTIAQKDIPEVNVGKFIGQTDDYTKQLTINESTFLQNQGRDKNWLNQQEQLYNEGKTQSPVVENYFKSREGLQTKIQQNQQLVADINKEADKRPDLIVNNLIPKGSPNLTIALGNGSSTVISPEEIVSFNTKLNDIYSEKYGNTSMGVSAGGGPAVGSTFLDDTKAAQILSPKEKILYNSYKKYFNGQNLSAADKTVVDNIINYNKTVNLHAGEVSDNRLKFMNQQLINRTGEAQRVAYTIPAGKAEERNSAQTLVGNLLANAEEQGKSFGTGDVANYSDLKKMNDDNDATYSLVVKDATSFSGGKYWMRVNGGKGKQQDIPITQDQKTQIFGNAFENAADNAGFRDIKQQLLMTAKGSTNFNLGNETLAPSTAYLGKNDFPQTNRFSVKGDVIEQNGGYALRMYIYDPINKKTQTVDYAPNAGLMDEKSALTAMHSMNDGVIYQLLYDPRDKDGKPIPITQDMLDKISNLNKKPF